MDSNGGECLSTGLLPGRWPAKSRITAVQRDHRYFVPVRREVVHVESCLDVVGSSLIWHKHRCVETTVCRV